MSTRNEFHAKEFRRIRLNWQTFDALPLGVKRILWDLPFKASLSIPKGVTEAQALASINLAEIRRKFAHTTLETYGYEHPGVDPIRAEIAASRPRTSAVEAEDLGF